MDNNHYLDITIGSAPSATRLLAQEYATGNGMLQDYCTAAELYRQAMEEGDDMATCLLGECYFSGAGVKKDYATALRYYQQSETIRGHSRAHRYFRDGKMCRTPNLTDFPGLEQAAQKNAPGACTVMGYLFFLGKVGYRDFEEGVRWYRQAGNDPEALFCLGFAHAVGAGVERDIQQAAAYFRAAAKQDFLPAAYNLTVCSKYDRNPETDALSEHEWDQAQAFMKIVSKMDGIELYRPEQFWRDRDMDTVTKIITKEMSEEADTESEA